MYHQFNTVHHVKIRHDERSVVLVYSFTGPYGDHYTVEQPMSPKEARRWAKLLKKRAKAVEKQ